MIYGCRTSIYGCATSIILLHGEHFRMREAEFFECLIQGLFQLIREGASLLDSGKGLAVQPEVFDKLRFHRRHFRYCDIGEEFVARCEEYCNLHLHGEWRTVLL